ncbi:MAG: right-handed parallel beta-helix repeat-containing protein [Acidobacteria bacterium]|nr:right-handed parallel beta-helix repeat-containing protein [Acidobacteriota bacterium]
MGSRPTSEAFSLEFFLSIVLLTISPTVFGATTVSSSPTTDATWTLAGSPYTLTANITVPAGVTLTVEPGVQVLANSEIRLDVVGALVAVGTSGAPITFTRSGTSGNWSGILITASSGTASLDWINVSHGGNCTYCANLYVENSTTVTVSNASFSDSNTDGIYAYSGSVDVSDSSFTNNVGYAIRYGSGSANPILARLTATGNGTDAVALGGGTMSGAHVWENTGLPYEVTGVQSVGASASLTISPGVEVRFGASTDLVVNGTLDAVTSQAAPIVLTGVTATPGSWSGVRVVAGSATLDSVSISDGGGCTYCAGLYVENGSAEITRSTFSNNSNDGVYVYSGNANVSHSAFTGNSRYAIHYGSAQSNPVLLALTASGNGTNAVAIGSGTMTGSHEWEATGVPYIVTGAQSVAAGSTLVIQPGVQVAFLPSTVLQVNGTIGAVGAPGQPIALVGASSEAGSWQGVKIGGTATLDFVSISGGGSCTYCANLYVEGSDGAAQAVVRRSSFSNSAKDGIWVWYGNAHVSDSSFSGNARHAVHYESASVNGKLSGLSSTGPGTNAVAIGGGTISGAHVWEAAGLRYLVTGHQHVSTGSSLTIEPGVNVAFEPDTRLAVAGLLRASGSEALPISLTGAVAAPGSRRR